MIDTLAGKIEEFIIIEINLNMLTWFQEWKRQVNEKEDTTFEL
jgi:hypothetical protein